MSYVVCCTSVEAKYRKSNGVCKVVNDQAIQVSEIDVYLNDIMRKSNFGELISVKLTNIHVRPLRSADDTDDSDEEEDEVEEETSSDRQAVIVCQ